MHVYSREDLSITDTNSNFQTNKDDRKSISRSMFTLGGRAVVWRSIKQSCVANSTMEVEYVAASEASMEVIWLRNFLIDLEVVSSMEKPINLYCDNTGAIANIKEPRHHKRTKHIERRYHLIQSIMERGDVNVLKITLEDNHADPFRKTLPAKVFEKHMEGFGLKDMSHLL